MTAVVILSAEEARERARAPAQTAVGTPWCATPMYQPCRCPGVEHVSARSSSCACSRTLCTCARVADVRPRGTR